MLAAVSNSIVRTYRETLGRGPTRARSHLGTPDVLVCVLQDTLTPSERSLLDCGEHAQVRAGRASLSRSMEPELRAAVEQLTSRRVITVVSGFNPWDDTACETFLLAGE
jgi:uncharacterized protein YbcI